MNDELDSPRQRKQEEKMSKGRVFAPTSARAARRAAIIVTSLGVVMLAAAPVRAQYSSGSSGVHGVFPPAAVPPTARYLLWDLRTGLVRFCSAYDATTRPDTCITEISTAQIPGIPAGGLRTGVFEFSSVDVPTPTTAGQLEIYPVGYDGPTPLTILSQTSFRLRQLVVLRLDGAVGSSSQTGLPPTGVGAPGGRPGPGGHAGGNGGKMGTPSTPGNPGFGPAGGAAGPANAFPAQGGNAGVSVAATSLVPLAGGSGGGGSGAFDTGCSFRGGGGGGGAGGGAVLVAASAQIIFDPGTGINARGASGGSGCQGYVGGSGSGGSVRLVATTISGTGAVVVGNGIVRFEGNTSGYSGTIEATRGTVLAAPQPAMPTDFPSIRIMSVGGIAVGPTPSGSASAPDVTFPTAPAGPVVVDLAAANIPLGTVVNLRANPVIGSVTTATSSALAGSVQNSSASASLTIPAGAGVITAVTSFPVTVAMMERLPAIPGLTPVRVEVVAEATGGSRVFLIGAHEKRVEVTMGAGGAIAIVQ